MIFAGIILYGLLSLLVPVLIIVLIVRLVMHHRNDGRKRPIFGYREVMLAMLILSAGVSGLAGLFILPFALFGDGTDYTNQALVVHLISAIALLIVGLMLKQVTGKFLMILGLIMLISAFGPAFETLGSGGALIAVVLAFAVLIAITVRVSRKARHNG